MKSVRDWDEDYVLRIASGEFGDTEVKGRMSLDLNDVIVKEANVRETLAKALSAFANSGGGYLIYGVKDPKKWINNVPEVEDGGVPITLVSKGDTREWLDSVISNL